MSTFPVASDSVNLDTAQVETTDVWASGFRTNPVTGGVRASFSNSVSTYNQGIPLDSSGVVCLVDSTSALPTSTWSNGVPLSSEKVCLSMAAMATYLNGMPMAANGGLGGQLVPSMSLYFLGTASLDSRITFTRADAVTCATYFDSTGRMQTVAANVARFDYDPATLLPRGLLIEESRKNNLLHSRDMTQAAWGKTDTTPTRNQVGVDGTANSATLLTEGSAGTASTAQLGAAVTAGSTLTGSMVVKKSGHGFVMLFASETTAVDGAYAIFDLTNGLVSATTNIGAGASSSASITNLGGGWYRCTVTCLPNGTYTVPRLQIRSATSLASNTRVSGATYIVDCAQLEVGAFATSIIPTAATALTRAADSASMTGANFSSWFNASAGTFVAEADALLKSTAQQSVLSADDGTLNNRLELAVNTLFKGRLQVVTGGVAQSDINDVGTAIAANTAYKLAATFAANDFQVCLNTTLGTQDTSGTVPTVTQLVIGGRGVGGTPYNGHIRSLRYYPTRLPNATLQALTA